MKVVVTGATGFVGYNLVNELLKQNAQVTVIVRDKRKLPIEWTNNVHFVEAELGIYRKLEVDMFLGMEYDVFYHLAWEGTSGIDRADEKLQLANVQGSIEAVHLAKRLGCRRFVYAGSIMEYEAIAYCKENSVTPRPGSIYSIAKLTADYMAKTVALNNGLEYINVVISNIYGVGEKSKRFLNTILRQMLKNEKIALTEGRQLYDFIYITDAVKAIILAAQRGKNNTEYYIGNTEQKPLREYVIEMKKVLRSHSELAFGAIEFQGMPLTYTEFDTKRLCQLGYKPEYSFEEGILATRDWMMGEKDEYGFFH